MRGRLVCGGMLAMVLLVLGSGGALAASGPTGSFTLDNGTTTVTADGFVSVQYQASGPNPISLVYASNSNQVNAQGALTCPAQWQYGETISTFSLTQQSCAPNTADGLKTVYAQFVDSQGLHSPVYSQSILLDTTGPVWTQAAQWSFVTPQTVSAASVKMAASWATNDLTPVTSNAQLSVNGGAFSPAPVSSPTATNFTVTTPFGQQLETTVSPLDAVGNYSDPATEQANAYAQLFDQTSSAYITWKGGWKLHSSTSYLGGSDKAATAAGATATFTFSGKAVTFLTTTSPTRGKVDLAVDGTPVGTVDLYSSTTRNRRVVWSHTFSTSAMHTVTLTVQGTPGRPRVDVDAFLVST
jgi:hypothetical protein